MKRIVFGLLLAVALLFGSGIVGYSNVQAGPLLAQSPSPAVPSVPPKVVDKDTPPAPTPPKPETAIKPPAAVKVEPPKENPPGPYDMEAIKAFNRALYGS